MNWDYDGSSHVRRERAFLGHVCARTLTSTRSAGRGYFFTEADSVCHASVDDHVPSSLQRACKKGYNFTHVPQNPVTCIDSESRTAVVNDRRILMQRAELNALDPGGGEDWNAGCESAETGNWPCNRNVGLEKNLRQVIFYDSDNQNQTVSL